MAQTDHWHPQRCKYRYDCGVLMAFDVPMESKCNLMSTCSPRRGSASRSSISEKLLCLTAERERSCCIPPVRAIAPASWPNSGHGRRGQLALALCWERREGREDLPSKRRWTMRCMQRRSADSSWLFRVSCAAELCSDLPVPFCPQRVEIGVPATRPDLHPFAPKRRFPWTATRFRDGMHFGQRSYSLNFPTSTEISESSSRRKVGIAAMICGLNLLKSKFYRDAHVNN